MTAAHEDAKAALKSLLAATQSSRSKENSSANQDKDKAGLALRQLFRTDFIRALQPAEADVRQADIEAKLSRLLEKASKNGTNGQKDLNFKPPARVSETQQKPQRKPRENLHELCEKLGPEPYDKPKPAPPRRSVVVEDEAGRSAGAKVKLRQARKELNSMDKRVTELTRNLRECRKSVWEQQRVLDNADYHCSRLISERADEFPAADKKELEELDAKCSKLSEELSEARTEHARWLAVAKRQDGMLQQEREAQKGGDAQAILARHPAGEIFLPPMPTDSDSEDEPEPRRRPAQQQQQQRRNENVSLGSSDEDEEDFSSTVTSATRALEQSKRLGRVESASDDESIGSSAPSPSAASGSGPVQSDSESAKPSPKNAAPKAIPAARSSANDSTSEEEEEVEKEEKTTTGKPVPSLPDLAGMMIRQRPVVAAQEDSAEEVSSEEIETSRSV